MTIHQRLHLLTVVALALPTQRLLWVYLNILQLGFHGRVVFCCLDRLALHIGQKAAYVVQLSLWDTGEQFNL